MTPRKYLPQLLIYKLRQKKSSKRRRRDSTYARRSSEPTQKQLQRALENSPPATDCTYIANEFQSTLLQHWNRFVHAGEPTIPETRPTPAPSSLTQKDISTPPADGTNEKHQTRKIGELRQHREKCLTSSTGGRARAPPPPPKHDHCGSYRPQDPSPLEEWLLFLRERPPDPPRTQG